MPCACTFHFVHVDCAIHRHARTGVMVLPAENDRSRVGSLKPLRQMFACNPCMARSFTRPSLCMRVRTHTHRGQRLWSPLADEWSASEPALGFVPTVHVSPACAAVTPADMDRSERLAPLHNILSDPAICKVSERPAVAKARRSQLQCGVILHTAVH